MKPTLGRIVIVQGFAANGSLAQAAVVTRIWPPNGLLNLMVLPDVGVPTPLQAITFVDDEHEAVTLVAQARRDNQTRFVAHWPTKVA